MIRRSVIARGENAEHAIALPPRAIELSFQSTLRAPAAEVWNAVSTMAGVNAELGPWFHMTVPARARRIRLDDAPTRTVLFRSWILLLGVPVDRHALRLEEVVPGASFREHSTSWLEASWVHERVVRDAAAGGPMCTVEDRLTFRPRLAILAPLLRRIVGATFRHRHGQLRRRFGGVESAVDYGDCTAPRSGFAPRAMP